MNTKIKKTAAQTAVLMAILTLISKCFGFGREMVIANYFGASYIVDAYVMSFTILSVLFGGVIAAVSTAYMPIFSTITENSTEEQGEKFTSQIINLLIVITFIISLVGIIFSDQIVQVFASGFEGETAKLASFYIKILFSYIIFASTAAILEAYLQYKGTFLPQVISGYFISICMIIATVVSAYTSCYYLAFGTIIGYALRILMMGYIAKKKGYKHYKGLGLGNNIRKIMRLALPVFIGSYITNINMFIDRTLASRLVEGSIAVLNYSALLNTMIIGVTITILSTIIYPKLTQANSLQEYGRFNEIVEIGMNLVIIIALPCSLGAMLYSSQIIQITYERGAFEQAATAMTSSAFKYYAAGLLFMALNDYVIRIYYSIHDMKTPMIFGTISVIINISLNIILVKTMQHNGLALATSIAAVANSCMLIIGIKYLHPRIVLMSSIKKIGKVLLAAILSIMSSYLSYLLIITWLSHIIYMRIMQFGIAVLIAAIAYVLMLSLFKVEEVKMVATILHRSNND